MGLEDLTGSSKYISDLVETNPTSGDSPAQGDDHARGTKNVLKNTFPNISGAVTPTHTVLNYMLGVTSAVQTQIDGKQTSNANLTDIAGITQTKGDLLVSDGSDIVDVAVGTNDQVLTADSTQASGVKWADLPSSGADTDLSNLSATGGNKIAKAWVNFDGTAGTITAADSLNVSSITDNGTGNYTVNLTTAMGNTNYAAIACCSGDGSYINRSALSYVVSTSAVRVTITTTGNSPVLQDEEEVFLVVFGD